MPFRSSNHNKWELWKSNQGEQRGAARLPVDKTPDAASGYLSGFLEEMERRGRLRVRHPGSTEKTQSNDLRMLPGETQQFPDVFGGRSRGFGQPDGCCPHFSDAM